MNVSEIFLSLITIFVGIFIAVSLQKRQNKNQNLYNFLAAKLDDLWNRFNSFGQQIEYSQQIEVKSCTAFFKEFDVKFQSFKKMFGVFRISDTSINQLSKEIEELEKIFFDKCSISNNTISYFTHINEIRFKKDALHSLFAEILKTINRIS